jgi:hypothetical protein
MVYFYLKLKYFRIELLRRHESGPFHQYCRNEWAVIGRREVRTSTCPGKETGSVSACF